MTAVNIMWRNVFRNLKRSINLRKLCSKEFHTIYEKEFSVTPFCHLNINGSFQLNVKPLDVYKYTNADKVFINFMSSSEDLKYILKCENEDDVVTVQSRNISKDHDLVCSIDAPVKASITASLTMGNICLSNFHGDILLLETDNGNIAADNCYCQKIQLTTEKGNITSKKVLQAAEIYLRTGNFGNIVVDKLQGVSLMVTTKNGSIRAQSSYCNDSMFCTEEGDIILINAHKNCKAHVKTKGNLDILRFDGVLEAVLNEGIANIQLSRLQGNSQILIKEKGVLNLELFERCQDRTCLKIVGKNVNVDKDVKMVSSKKNEEVFLKGRSTKNSEVSVVAAQSEINIQSANLTDLFFKTV